MGILKKINTSLQKRKADKLDSFLKKLSDQNAPIAKTYMRKSRELRVMKKKMGNRGRQPSKKHKKKFYRLTWECRTIHAEIAKMKSVMPDISDEAFKKHMDQITDNYRMSQP